MRLCFFWGKVGLEVITCSSLSSLRLTPRPASVSLRSS